MWFGCVSLFGEVQQSELLLRQFLTNNIIIILVNHTNYYYYKQYVMSVCIGLVLIGQTVQDGGISCQFIIFLYFFHFRCVITGYLRVTENVYVYKRNNYNVMYIAVMYLLCYVKIVRFCFIMLNYDIYFI